MVYYSIDQFGRNGNFFEDVEMKDETEENNQQYQTLDEHPCAKITNW